MHLYESMILYTTNKWYKRKMMTNNNNNNVRQLLLSLLLIIYYCCCCCCCCCSGLVVPVEYVQDGIGVDYQYNQDSSDQRQHDPQQKLVQVPNDNDATTSTGSTTNLLDNIISRTTDSFRIEQHNNDNVDGGSHKNDNDKNVIIDKLYYFLEKWTFTMTEYVLDTVNRIFGYYPLNELDTVDPANVSNVVINTAILVLFLSFFIYVCMYVTRKYYTTYDTNIHLQFELNSATEQLRYLQEKLQQPTSSSNDEQTTNCIRTDFTNNNTKNASTKEIRIFMDGAFDLLHFGHMNAFRLARSLGTHLIVGVNSDESITECKGPPLMNNEQRTIMVQSCKFVDTIIENCPYIMNEHYLNWVIQEYNISYVVHGDDPCFVNGVDVYATAKATGKFRTIPRTTGVSTTDIMGRMLTLTKEHHFYIIEHKQNQQNQQQLNQNQQQQSNISKGSNNKEEDDEDDDLDDDDKNNNSNTDIDMENDINRRSNNDTILPLVQQSTSSSATAILRRRRRANSTSSIGSSQYTGCSDRLTTTKTSTTTIEQQQEQDEQPIIQSRFLTTSRMLQLFSNDVIAPTCGMKVIYIDGSFDLFHPGHVTILQLARQRGDYLLVGIHGDNTINKIHGMNLPLMNLHERVLSVLGCRYVNDVLIDAPLIVTKDIIQNFNISEVVYFEQQSSSTSSSPNNISTSLDRMEYSYETIRYKYPIDIGIYTKIILSNESNKFNIIDVIERIRTNQETFQAKFERKMKAEVEYYNTTITEKNSSTNNNSSIDIRSNNDDDNNADDTTTTRNYDKQL